MKRESNSADRVDVGGDELTRLIKHTFRGDFAEGFKQYAGDPDVNEFREKLARISAECETVLKSSNLPSAWDVIAIDADGGWTPIGAATDPATGKRRKGFGSSTGARYVMGACQVYSEEWYAAAIGEICGELDGASDPSDSVYQNNILQLGHLITDRFWRLKYKRSILRGARVRKGAQEGGAARANQLGEDTRKVLKAMETIRMSKPELSISRIAELVFKKGKGKSPEGNRQLWYAHRKRKL